MTQWVVLEMKLTLREHAAQQARAALCLLGEHRLFPFRLDGVAVWFVVKRPRRSDYTIMHNIGTIETGRWRVRPRLYRSGDTVSCRDHDA